MRQVHLSLASLVPSRRNPRKVKPDRDAHRQMVASIQAIGLLHPLTVRPHPEIGGHYLVIAGHRRLAGLRDIHRGKGDDAKVWCQVREADDHEADTVSLSENFSRSPMHPLDEAEAFSKLAGERENGIEAVAAEFGVPERYVRQRMKLAALNRTIKTAYRDGGIDTATAETFATLPDNRQAHIWQEVDGRPHGADHIRRIIDNGWLDVANALFDVASLPENVVTRDLFSERVLVEREAFMAAQLQALGQQRQTLLEEGWSAAFAGPRNDLSPQMQTLEQPEREFDEATTRKLAKLQARREQLEKAFEEIEEGDNAAYEKANRRLDALDAAERNIMETAPVAYSEATKGIGTAFLVLELDGRVNRLYFVPRNRCRPNDHAGETVINEPRTPLTAGQLNDRQLATAFTHQALAVREALLENPLARKRLLAVMLHDNVHAEALSVRHDANRVTIHATHEKQFASPVWDKFVQRRQKIDPLSDSHSLSDNEAYEKLSGLSAAKLDALIDLLLVQTLTTHAVRRLPLVERLGAALKVDVRTSWRPDAGWLANYQKCQLTSLLAELLGPAYDPARETRKKSELVEFVATLFNDAAEGKLDKMIADRVNKWVPSNLRPETEQTAGARAEAA